MANPRKFSEKIALQKQKQAEGTAEFERIMKEVHQTKMDETQVNQKILEYCLRSGGNTAPATSSNNGGSGNGVGGGGGGTTGAVNNDNLLNKSVDKQIINDNKNEEVVSVASVGAGAGAAAVTETQLITTEGGVEATPLATGGSSPLQTIGRESRVRSVGVGPIRRPSDRKQDRSPYGSTTFANATNVATNTNIGVNHMNNTNFYLSPPQDTNWRRSNSDSALHQSLNMAVNAEIQSGMNAMLPIDDVNNVNVVTVGQHSPHMVRRLSANQAAMRRKAVPMTNMQQQQQQHQQHQQQQQQMQQQQQQQHNYHMLQQQQQQQQRELQQAMQQQQQHIQEQQQQQHYVTQHQQQQQQQLHFNSNKFLNCNSTLSPINNSFFKTFSDQSFGSLPDLSSVHFNGSGNNTNTTPTTTTRAQQQQQQQHQQILSPLTIDYHDQPQQQQRERTPSPYIEQQHSPNFAQNTQVVAPQYTQSTTVSFGNLSTSSEMKNEPLTVCISLNQSHNAQQQQQQQPMEQLMRSNLPTLGAASSAGNLTEYRQPLNPPSPGSSPGLLTSASGNELHMSAPSSPIRYMQNNSSTSGGSATTNNTTMQGGSLIQTFDNVFGGNNDVLSTSGHFDNNNSYNQFHNHFEHFTLGDSNSSPDQHQQTYLDLTHDFGIDYGNMVDDDLTPDLTINELTAAAATSLTSADLNATSDGTNLFNVINDEHHNKDNDVNVLKKNQQQQLHDDSRQHNYQQQQQQHKNKQTSYSQRKHQEQQQQQQQLQSQQQQQPRLINKTTTTTTKSNNYNQNTDNIINNNNNNNHLNNNETAQQQQQQQHNIDTTTANIVGLINSPTSPMPIPLPAAQSPIHQQHHAHSPHMQQQSPLHSPLTMQQQHMQQRYQQQQQQQTQNKNTAQQQQQQSPHHTTATTTTTTDTSMNTIGSHHNSPMSSPLHSPASSVAYNGNSKLLNNVDLHHHHHQQQQQQQQQQHNQQQQFNQLLNDGTQTQTQTTTTTNIPSIIFSDYSSNADIFDAFDIGTLGSMDDVGLQMISEQNSIIITDPNIEDSFRRDFN